MCAREIVIEPPVTGHWAIYNPPGHPKLAFDFLAEDEHHSLYNKGTFLRHLVSFIPVENTLTWSRPVFSPVDGVVIASHDGEPDRGRISFVYDLVNLRINRPHVSDGFAAFGGNHIMIQADDCYVLLCHLKLGSLKVDVGDQVKAGQALAEIGNSGSSIQPHLHLQVMSNDQYFPLFENLLPFKFKQGKVEQDGNWTFRQDITLKNRTHYLFDNAH